MVDSYFILIEKLDEFIRKFYKNILIKGVIYSFSLVLVFFVSITLLEYFAHFSSLIRSFLFYSFISSTSVIVFFWIIIPLLKLFKLGKVISHEQAANIIGTHFNAIEDKLLNVLQLHEQKNNTTGTISKELIEAGINQKINDLKPIPFNSAIDFKKNRRYLKYAVIPVLALSFILFTAPSILTVGTERIVDHQKYFEEPAPFTFEILNTDLKTIQSEDFILDVKISGNELPENAYIEIENSKFKLDKKSKLLFNYTFKNIQSSTKFKLMADGFYSKEYELKSLPNPLLLNFDIHLDYPVYTGKKNEIVKNTGDIIIPAGTKAKWIFNTRNTLALKLNINDSNYMLSPNPKDIYTFSQRLLKNTTYLIKTANDILVSKDSMLYAITVIPDLYPSIEMDEQVDSSSSKRIYFRGIIKDDYGFKKLTFNYSGIGSDSSKSFANEIIINKNQTQNQFFHFWDISGMKINPGDQIEYFFEVFDNDGIYGSKSARTQKMIFKAPSLSEIAEKTEKNNKEIKKDLEKSIKEAKDIQKELNDFNKKLLEKKTLSWEEKKKLEELLNKQKNLQKNLEDIKNENKQNNKQQSEYKQVEERILEKQQQLEKMFDELMSDEMKEKMQQLEKLMEELKKDKLQEAIDEMKMDNKDLEKELDRSLELFKQMEFEQKMQETIDNLKKLAEKQEKLAEKSEDKKTDSEDLKKEQDDLNKEFENLEKDLENLEKKNEELENKNKTGDTKEEAKKTENEMKKSSEELKENKKKKAAESQKKAADKMQEMAKKMEQAMEQNESENSEEDADALRDILENLVKLSLDQEGLMTKLKSTDKNDPQYLKITQDQKRLKDDARMVEDSLFALSKRVPQLDAHINKEINAINMNLEKALDNLTDRQIPLAANRQQYVMTSANNLALLLSEVLNQMQQQMAKQKQKGNQSCSKPGSNGKPKPSAGNMRKMQEQINKEIQKLKQQMEKEGGQPKGQKKGQNQGMSQGLAKMAAQQESIRRQMQELIKELDKKGNGGSGNLDKLSKKMEETENELVNKKISNETLKRQQEILTRLLEAENAEREREMDEKRKSNESKSQNFSNPSDFFEYKRLKEKEAELLKTVPASLYPFYKNKVSEYFNKIED